MRAAKRHVTIALAFWGVTIAPLVLFHMLAGAPRHGELVALRAKVETLRDRYEFLKGIESPREKARLRQEIADARAAYGALVFPGKDAGGLDFRFGEVAAAARVEGLSSKTLFGGQNPAFSKFACVAERNYKLSFSADFRSFVAFVNGLERHEPVVFVDGFSLVRDLGDPSRASGEMEIAVLYEKER